MPGAGISTATKGTSEAGAIKIGSEADAMLLRKRKHNSSTNKGAALAE